MSINRRQFLKRASVVTALGLTGAFTINGLRSDNVVKATNDAHSGNADSQRKRWGMVIDMTKFESDEDIQKVIDACHKAHNVPSIESPKEEIKWIWTDGYFNTFPGMETRFLDEKTKNMKFIVTCNHCDNPSCVRVCPTKATFKNKDGIVAMDMHRCVGCRFCMAACPYGARSFNWRDPRPYIEEPTTDYPTRCIGVVEKCNFCVDRLKKGLEPVCVEASNGAIVFGDLNDPNSEVRQILSSNYTIRRKAGLGTEPSVYYLIGGEDNA